ncbi:hypothetical protein BKA64DRAFT_671056 [Cadophora sp. MPI-SDFR-AT-0126]|nr:hypothetical protein BKA64DRAFT_671056 [Leotiomycetes sp. MPI-SDFR-AT-0126]
MMLDLMISTNGQQDETASRLRRKEIREHLKMPHPNRETAYELFCDICKDWSTWGPGWKFQDDLYKDWIRTVSNVSPRFRHELGLVFWTRVHIVDNSSVENFIWTLPAFLRERPAIHLGIKYAFFRIDLINPVSDQLRKFEDWCHYVSTCLKLERFDLRLDVKESDLERIHKGEDEFAYLASCRSIPVSHTFEIILTIWDTRGRWDWNEVSGPGDLDMLEEKYRPLIREMMLPDSLRKPPTEESLYLESRPQPPSLPVEESEESEESSDSEDISEGEDPSDRDNSSGGEESSEDED